ncbi:hypothetical protein SCB49_10417 [unidentified eubacterium SCB49]|nr:hypothetical protein SCB49_10417 [unidentified eubacterium SCB49]
MTKKRSNFLEMYSELDDSETLKELLYINTLKVEKLEKIRANTSKLIWWLIVIPIFIFVMALFLGNR